MSGNYKVKIKDIQNKYKFKIFCASNYDDSELKRMYEAIYMALPKESSSGTSITLNDTAKSFMKNELNATETSQKTTTGKNLLNPFVNHSAGYKVTTNGVTFTINDDGTIKAVGTPTADATLVLFGSWSGTTSYGTLDSAKTYKVSGGTSDGERKVFIRTKNGSTYSTYNDSSQSTITNASEIVYFAITVFPNAGTTDFTFKPMIEEGSTATDYEPFTNGASPNPSYPQDIHTINGDNKINVEGKNLAIKNVKGYFNAGATTIAVDGDSESFVFYAVAGQTYTFSSLESMNRRVVAKVDTLNIVNNTPISNSRGFTGDTITSEFTGYCIVYVNSSLNDNIKNSFMLNVGTTALPYEPYQSNSVLLTLGDKEIFKIGNYEDKIFKAIKGNEIYDSLSVEEKNTLDYGKWYLRKAIGKVNYDGFSAVSGYENLYMKYVSDYAVQNAFSNYFTNVVDSRITNNQGANAYLNNEQFTFRDGSSKDRVYVKTSLTAEQLNNLNAMFCYVLATPTNELFNDAQQEQLEDIYNNMLSYEGQTNISQINNDLPFNINSSALKDLSDL